MYLTICVDQTSPTTTVFRLAGELDIAAAHDVRRSAAAIAAGVDVRLDLSEVVFMDCAGLRALERCSEEVALRGGTFALASASVPVRRILAMTGSDLRNVDTDRDFARGRRRPSRFVRSAPAVAVSPTGAQPV